MKLGKRECQWSVVVVPDACDLEVFNVTPREKRQETVLDDGMHG